MAARRATTVRVVETGPQNGYGPGRWLAQYFDPGMHIWFDIGDPHDTKAEAEKAAFGPGHVVPGRLSAAALVDEARTELDAATEVLSGSSLQGGEGGGAFTLHHASERALARYHVARAQALATMAAALR